MLKYTCIFAFTQERTNNSFFRQSVSPFRSTASEWHKIVHQNKSAIRSEDERKKDEIMGIHYDLRLKNTSSFKVSERMNSMRLHAKKMASEYLWSNNTSALGIKWKRRM